jgi:hypothetical protein
MIPTERASNASCALHPGRNPYEKPKKVLLINLIEDRSHCMLDDFVLQGGYPQRSLSSILLEDIGSLGR